MFTFTHILSILLLAATLVGCERSSRNVDVQPSTGKLPTADNKVPNGGTPESGTPSTGKKYGQINLSVSGADGLSGSANYTWSFNGGSDTGSMTLTNGSGSAAISSAPVGSDTLSVSLTVNNVAYKGSASVVVYEGITKTASVTLARDSNPTTPPNNNNTNNGGDTSVIINPTIGQPTNNNNNNNNQTGLWDGKSFRGNSRWTIEAIN